jgi:hypothetical protein
MIKVRVMTSVRGKQVERVTLALITMRDYVRELARTTAAETREAEALNTAAQYIGDALWAIGGLAAAIFRTSNGAQQAQQDEKMLGRSAGKDA